MARVSATLGLSVLCLVFTGTACAAAAVGMTITAAPDTSTILRTTDDRYLSVNIDGSQLAHFPFQDSVLNSLAQGLGGRSYLRVGGTDCDAAFYSMTADCPSPLPPGYKLCYSKPVIDGLCSFAASASMKVVFGINAARGPRNNSATGPWYGDNARELMTYVYDNHPTCVYAWEFGNEPNLWFFTYGLIISATQMVDDFKTMKSLMLSINPQWLLVGNDCAFQIPLVGEFLPVFTDWMKDGGGQLVDIITWHWYPLEGPDCPLDGFPVAASPTRVITPTTLAMDIPYRDQVLQYAAKYARNDTKVWLGEMAAASCGGMNNVTDAWAGAFYYLDKLGMLSEQGHDAVLRQSLYSSKYGLISDTGGNFANPDYWSAALWNRLMDNRVLSVGIEPAIVDDTSTYRVFAHCTLNSASAGNTTHALFPTSAGGVTVLVLNVHPTAPLSVASFGALSTGSGNRYQYVATSAGKGEEMAILTSRSVVLNGLALQYGTGGVVTIPDPHAVPVAQPLALPPLSYAFVVFNDTNAAACM